MMPSLFQSSTIPMLEQVIGFSQARHGVLAGNIANLNTPGYQTRDLSVDNFRSELKKALQTQRSPQGQMSPGIIAGVASNAMDPMAQVKDTMKSILYHDDSDVGVEQQVVELSNNQFMHNMAISVMTSQFRMLESAISERVV
jgi:flagellar basal-body rod protein FlgB